MEVFDRIAEQIEAVPFQEPKLMAFNPWPDLHAERWSGFRAG